jgi:hypothetical protein
LSRASSKHVRVAGELAVEGILARVCGLMMCLLGVLL